MISRLLTAGCIGGLIAGLLLSVIQQFEILPLIQQAERYEASSLEKERLSAGGPTETSEAWTPQQGAERLAYTVIANLGMAVGYALVLCAAFVFCEPKVFWHGLLWGLAGYMVFFLAPALKLPPELPGAASSDLQVRQLWWVATVLCSALGLFGVVFSKSALLKLLGAGILLMPYLIDGPPHSEYTGSAPELLDHRFVIAVGMVNFFFWLALGLVTSWSFRLVDANVET